MSGGTPRVVAIVPARGGTDRVPYLNVKRLGDRPLLAHTLEAARNARHVHRVVVSTDDERVAAIAREHGAEVPFLRPAELAGDIPSLKPVIAHAVAQLEAAGERPDVVVVLQVTTPFRDAAAIDAAVEKLLAEDLDSVVSVTEDRTLTWREQNGLLSPLLDDAEGRRDRRPPVFKENGGVVAMRRAVLDAPGRFGERIGHLVLDKSAAFTVFDLEDFWMAERLLRQPRILFRVDGGAELGMGHVYRSLAIADALRRTSRADVAFLMTADHPEGLVTASRQGVPVRVAANAELETYLEHIRDYSPAILINDLPRIEERYLRALSHVGASTVNLVDTLDDFERAEHYAQVIVSVMKGERETPEGFYGGPAYAILREHFRDRDKSVRKVPERVLLSFGGADPQGLTLKAIRALEPLPGDLELVAVTGPAFPWHRELEDLRGSLRRPLDVRSVEGGQIADLMLDADVVVGSGGMTVYEIAALGTPGVVLAQNVREEQRMRVFARNGTVEYLGLGTEVDEETIRHAVVALLDDVARRERMSAQGRKLVDGLGATRAAELVLDAARQREATLSRGETRE